MLVSERLCLNDSVSLALTSITERLGKLESHADEKLP